MNRDDSSRRKGCLIIVGVLALSAFGFDRYSKFALRRELSTLAAECSPGNLLEVYQPELYRRRSEETRKGVRSTSPARWLLVGDNAVMIRSIPLTAQTWVHRLYLLKDQTKVAALKFYGVDSPGFWVVQQSGIAVCKGSGREFQIDQLSHEFSNIGI